jgi:hypothetical protein
MSAMRSVIVRGVRCSILASVVAASATLPARAGQLESHAPSTRQRLDRSRASARRRPRGRSRVVTSAGGARARRRRRELRAHARAPADAQIVEVIATLADSSGSGALVARERLVRRGGASASLGSSSSRRWSSRRRTGVRTFGGKVRFDERHRARGDRARRRLRAGALRRGLVQRHRRHRRAADRALGRRALERSGRRRRHGLDQTLAVYDEGSGPRLFAGGSFTTVGGATTFNVARWNGASWSHLGSRDRRHRQRALRREGRRGNAALRRRRVHGRRRPSRRAIARWNGLSWDTLGAGTNGVVVALAEYDDGTGRRLRGRLLHVRRRRLRATASRSGTAELVRVGSGSGRR